MIALYFYIIKNIDNLNFQVPFTSLYRTTLNDATIVDEDRGAYNDYNGY